MFMSLKINTQHQHLIVESATTKCWLNEEKTLDREGLFLFHDVDRCLLKRSAHNFAVVRRVLESQVVSRTGRRVGTVTIVGS
jgi:hypothetical protein